MNLIIALALVLLPSHTVAYEAPKEIIEEKVLELTVEKKIIQEARKWGYSPTRALAIAKAESNLNPLAKSKTSSASGIFQFINSTWVENCTGDVFNEDDNIKCAVRMLAQGGEHHWNASKHAWGQIP